MTAKSQAAALLARIRWNLATIEDKRRNAERLNKGRTRKLSRTKRKDIARLAAFHRWKHHKR